MQHQQWSSLSSSLDISSLFADSSTGIGYQWLMDHYYTSHYPRIVKEQFKTLAAIHLTPLDLL